MKKYLLGLLLFSISILGYSEVPEDVKKAKGVVTEIADQVISKEPNSTVVYMTEKLQQFVESLKIPAEKVFQTLVKKQTISAWMELSLLLFFCLIGIVMFLITYNNWKNKENNWKIKNPTNWRVKEGKNYYSIMDDQWVGFIICSIVIEIICVIVTFAIGSDIIIGIFNPEYGAIKEIMGLF